MALYLFKCDCGCWFSESQARKRRRLLEHNFYIIFLACPDCGEMESFDEVWACETCKQAEVYDEEDHCKECLEKERYPHTYEPLDSTKEALGI